MGVNADVDALPGATELPAAAMLALVSFLTMMAVRTRLKRYYVAAGLSLGALILTKGAFFYVAFPLVAFLVWSITQRGPGVRASRLGAILFALAILIVIGPWIARNWLISGYAVVTERGGAV